MLLRGYADIQKCTRGRTGNLIFFSLFESTVVYVFNFFHRRKQIGQDQVYAVHSRGAKWGDLVSAVADCVPLQKRVWIDLFAMRQWNEDHVETFKCIRNVLERCRPFSCLGLPT